MYLNYGSCINRAQESLDGRLVWSLITKNDFAETKTDATHLTDIIVLK